MKIALVVTGGLHPSGREQVIPALISAVERLAKRHEVHAFALRHLPEPATYSLRGAVVHDLGRPEGRVRQWRTLRNALRAYGPFDILHGYWADPAGVLVAIAGHRFRVPSIVTCDSGEFTALPEIDYGLQRRPASRAAVTLACRLATRVHVTSGHMARLASSQGVSAVRFPLGVETRAVRPPRPPEGPPWRLLQTSALNRVKDHATLLRAVALVRAQTRVEVDLAGEDTLGGMVQSEAARLGLFDCVRFHGFVEHDRLRALRAQAHLYVQSSRHEAAGIAVLEAAAAGLPIVGTRVGFVDDWAGDAAEAVPPGDADALAAAILRLLNDPARRSALATAAHVLARQYDADKTTHALEALYSSVTEMPRG